jgi:hypothetical protein
MPSMSPEQARPIADTRHYLPGIDVNSMIHYDHDEAMEGTDRFVEALRMGQSVVAQEFAISFTPKTSTEIFEGKQIEGRRSAHGVSFGRVVTAHAKSGQKDVLGVALKPFYNPEDAITEMRGYKVIGSLAIPTFEPVGIFPAKHGDHFVGVTKRDGRLSSLDNSQWIVGRRADTEETVEMANQNTEMVKGISQKLAYIHVNGVFHPDGQIKNYTTDILNQIGIIDTEQQKIVKLGDLDSAQLAWEDIEKLSKSLIINNADKDGKMYGVGMLAEMSVEDAREAILELIIEPYIDQLGELQAHTTTSPEQLKQIDILTEGILDRFSQEVQSGWPKLYVDVSRR